MSTVEDREAQRPHGKEKEQAVPQKVQRLNYFSVLLYHLTGGRAYRGSADSPAGFLKLTTTGRK